MNWLFRRHFWIVHLVFLSITSIIAAKTFSTLLGYWASKSIPDKPTPKRMGPKTETLLVKNFSVANERNLFAARREPISLVDEELEQVSPGRWQDAGPSSSGFKLISTMVFYNPYDSQAVILDQNSGKARVFSIRECKSYIKKNDQSIETVLSREEWEPERACNSIFGQAELLRIEEYRVYILNNGKYEYLSLLEDDKGPIRRPPMELMTEEEGAGVRKKGPTSYEIDQNEFDKALSNVARLMTEARAVPELDASSANIGFKLVYLKEGSLFEKIGIEKMDVLTRINGFELNTPEKALQLFSKLRSASKFTIDLKRGDQSITLDYSVVR